MKQETQTQKVLIVLLLSLTLLAFIFLTLAQLKNGKENVEEVTPYPTEQPSINIDQKNPQNPPVSVPEEATISEIFEKESVSSQEDLLLLEEVSLEDDIYVDQDMNAMEEDFDFMFAE